MMQITVGSTKVLKTGEGDYGEWKLVSVTTVEDVKYSTFANGAEDIQPGSIIDISDLNEDKQGRKSFKKYEVIEEEATIQSQPKKPTLKEATKPNDEMTTDMWAEKQRIERSSIERQVSAKIAFEFGNAGDTEQTLEIAEEIYQWISGHKPTSEATQSASSPPEEKTKDLFEEQPPEPSLIEIAWLRESLETLTANGQTAFEEKSLLSYMRLSHKGIEGETVCEIASKLDQGGAAHLTKVIEDALAKVK